MKGQRVPKRAKLKAANGLSGMASPLLGSGSFASSYDLRALGKLTPVKDQNPFNTCWAFATYSSMESCLLPGETWDFSEKNIVNLSGYDGGEPAGGNYLMSTAYFARWDGPVKESDDPYPSGSWASSAAGSQAQKHVQEVLFLPDRSGSLDNDNIKQMVTDYGAVMTAMYMDEITADGYLNNNTTSYYFNGSGTTTANHAVAIVGWDDNYPTGNFHFTPAGKGAFIARNNWGTSWGDGGYFYISYYDPIVGTSLTVFENAESTGNYNSIYQYDKLGYTNNIGYPAGGTPTIAWMANIFTASANEELSAVAFYALTINTSYTINIYSNFNGTSFSGLLVSQSGTIPIAGYHTIPLNSTIPFSTGNKICVVVKLTTPGLNYPIAMEQPRSNYSSLATALTGQSYISYNGSDWSDLSVAEANTNACLKAFTISPVGIYVTSITQIPE
jgi:C1A family cysteine protease